MSERKHNHRKTARVEEKHVRFIEEENLNFSALTRDLLDKYMEHREEQDDFEL